MKVLTEAEVRALLEDDDAVFIGPYGISKRSVWCTCGMGCFDEDFATLEDALQYISDVSKNFTEPFLFTGAD